MAEPTLEEVAYGVARDDLAIYIPLVHRTDDGGAAMPPDHLLDYVIPAIMDDSLGHTLIVAPPGSVKTNTMIAACGWWLGRDPNQHIGYVCDNAERGNERSLAVRTIIEESPEYRTIFPETKPNPKRGWSQNQWYLERKNLGDKNASFLAAGMDTSILGARLDRIVFDDVWNQKIATSELEKSRAYEKLSKELITRLHPKRGRAIGICTRWGEDDFAAWATERGFHTIHIPALHGTGPDGLGDSYWEQYFPRQRLRCVNDNHATTGQCCIYRLIGSAAFAQQYMGEVAINESAIFQPSWWGSYDEEWETWDKGVISVDTAGWDPGTSKGDFAAIEVWLKWGSDYHCADVYEERLSFLDVKKIAVNLRQNWGLPILVEDVPWARPLIQDLQKETSGVVPWKVQGRSKQNRAEAVAGIVEAGRVSLPAKAPWRERFVNQYKMFPHVKHDDMVDAGTQALGYLDRNAGRKQDITSRLPFKRDWHLLSA